jgi:hypothetical protein
MKSGWMRLEGHVARMREKRMDNIEMERVEIGWVGVD